ncbi:MAG: hypothetical protein ABIS01_10125, partial [Ferruginibacter sp.]
MKVLPPERGDNTRHGKRFDATIHILQKHPFDKDFPGQRVTSSLELYTYSRGSAQNLNVLSYAIDSSIQKKWPVEWVIKYGKGRVCNSSMGHLWKDEIYPVSYRCIGFQTILICATEWLA